MYAEVRREDTDPAETRTGATASRRTTAGATRDGSHEAGRTTIAARFVTRQLRRAFFLTEQCRDHAGGSAHNAHTNIDAQTHEKYIYGWPYKFDHGSCYVSELSTMFQ